MDEAKRGLGQAYSDISSLLVDITISYQRGLIGMLRAVMGMQTLIVCMDDPTATLALSAESLFLLVAIIFRTRQERLLNLIWDRRL